jgi:GTP-binding protein
MLNMRKPIIALVGRPNVGKSTLFNRLVGEQVAIVDDTPGTTRDRLFGEAEWSGRYFDIVDTGGIDPTTGEGKPPLSTASADYIHQIRSQAELAVQEADAVLFLVDAISGVTPADREVAQILRRNQTLVGGKPAPPVFLVVNKSDNATQRMGAPEFYELGMGEPYPISAVHGTGTGDLLDELVASIGESEEEEDESVKIAIVGKPNAVDTRFDFNDIPITLIDTAGIRRRGRVQPGVEKYSVIRAMRAIERADVALLMIDAVSGITAQDAHIAGFILEAWKSAVVLVNKWDAIEKDTYTINVFTEQIRQDLNFMDYVPILFISAKTGQRVDQVLPLALRVQEERLARLTTGQINRIIQAAQDSHPAPSRSGKSLRMYYGTQVRSDPPTFMIYCNDPKLAHFTYLRYLENRLRAEYSFIGTPIRIVLKPRR